MCRLDQSLMAATDLMTSAEAQRAIYVDFEGRTKEDPVLLGVLYAEGRTRIDPNRVVLRHDIIDRTFEPLHRVDPLETEEYVYRYDSEVRHHWIAIREVVRRAENQDRLIVAWSQHELLLVQKACQADGLDKTFETHFRDGKATAKRWLRDFHPDQEPPHNAHSGSHKLAHYMDVVGWVVPPEFGAGNVGANLKLLRGALEKGKTWDTFTDSQRHAWHQVVGHNMHDCLGLRDVVTRAAGELDLATP